MTPRTPGLVIRWALVIAAAVTVAACSAGAKIERAPAASTDEAWRTTPLRDVRTGEEFRIDDLRGRVVIVESMAIWCVTCTIQQDEAAEALARVGQDDVAYISLDIDPNEAEEELARYADERGYGWRFAVASREAARSLAQAFGDQILSPPSTPTILIAPDGTVTDVGFGIRSARDIEAEVARLQP